MSKRERKHLSGRGAKSRTPKCPGQHDEVVLLPQTLGFPSRGDGLVLLTLGLMCVPVDTQAKVSSHQAQV